MIIGFSQQVVLTSLETVVQSSSGSVNTKNSSETVKSMNKAQEDNLEGSWTIKLRQTFSRYTVREQVKTTMVEEQDKDRDYEKVLLPVFHGERVEFSMFWCRLMAYAVTNGFYDTLQEDGTAEPAMPANSRALIPDNDIGEMQLQAIA